MVWTIVLIFSKFVIIIFNNKTPFCAPFKANLKNLPYIFWSFLISDMSNANGEGGGGGIVRCLVIWLIEKAFDKEGLSNWHGS